MLQNSVKAQQEPGDLSNQSFGGGGRQDKMSVFHTKI
jgi:hypothetical protein